LAGGLGHDAGHATAGEEGERIERDARRCVAFVKKMEEHAGECPWRELLGEADVETALGFLNPPHPEEEEAENCG
jgi:hypothetical protein